MPSFSGISHLLLDIEGTTCPVSFVADVLFPYASQQLPAYVERHGSDPRVHVLLEDVQNAWRLDGDPTAQSLLQKAAHQGWQPYTACTAYLQLLITQDRKLTALKDLQGLIWRGGYAAGELVAPLYPDVPAALQRWHHEGTVLGVYSSGSVEAQQLLYRHSIAGDLTPLFSHWFDTRIGPKHSAKSYEQIAQAMQTTPSSILFVSDALAECEAAAAAGLQVLFSSRPGNPQQNPGPFAALSTYDDISLSGCP
jgi:enolase-phosphatase E1